MTIQQRLEAIQALTVATASLSKSKFKKYDLARALAELQHALEVLGIDKLSIDDCVATIASEINK
tara:strand:+ start:431 stop:625 length:195 start_codon:yes stop_codon:yes gene_type:complete